MAVVDVGGNRRMVGTVGRFIDRQGALIGRPRVDPLRTVLSRQPHLIEEERGVLASPCGRIWAYVGQLRTSQGGLVVSQIC